MRSISSVDACCGPSHRNSSTTKRHSVAALLFLLIVILCFATSTTAQPAADACDDIPCTSLQLLSDLKDLTKLSTYCRQEQFFDPEICCNSQDISFANTIPTCNTPSPCLDLSFEDNYDKCCSTPTANALSPWKVKRCCDYAGVSEANEAMCCQPTFFPGLCLSDQKKCCKANTVALNSACCDADSDLFNWLEQFDKPTALKCCQVSPIPESLKPQCPSCTYTGTDAQIKACCDQAWSREPCCKLAAFENDARCEAFSGCEDITNPTDLLNCCKESAPTITTNCCVFPDFATNPICTCDYNADRVRCCAQPDGFVASECCSIAPYKDNPAVCPPQCDYVGNTAQCCAQRYDKTKCCNKAPNGFYDSNKCCLEPMTSSYFDQTKCTPPPTCEMTQTPEKCCTEDGGIRFDEDFCCGQYNFFDVAKCCKLPAPLNYHPQCPCTGPECPTCDYKTDPVKCCADLFIHSKCCYLGPGDDYKNPKKFYDDDKCCRAYEHDWLNDKCCPQEKYKDDKRCPTQPPCSYTGTDAQIKACCDQTWSREPCCKLAAFENDARCEAFSGCEDITNPAELLTCCKESAPTISKNCCAFPDFATNPICTCDYNADRVGCCARPDGFRPSECCSIPPYNSDPVVCPPEPPCDYTGTTDQIKTCCLESFNVDKCCTVFPDDRRCPVTPCDYTGTDAEIIHCCQTRGFDITKCCIVLPLEPKCPVCESYTGTPAYVKACCTRQFDVAGCCAAFPTDFRCPPAACDYTATPIKCCQENYDATKCCNKAAGGYYDNECCAELATSPFFDATRCPSTCWSRGDIRADVCCKTEWLDSKCCDATSQMTYYDTTKCCTLPKPFYVEAKCNKCPDGTPLPCEPEPPCDFTKSRDACCKTHFDHHKCCHSAWHSIPGQYYLTERCCEIPMDFRPEKCCSLPQYSCCSLVGLPYEDAPGPDPRCSCDYTGTTTEIKGCCNRRWNKAKCCLLPDFQNDQHCRVITQCEEFEGVDEVLDCCRTVRPIQPYCCEIEEFAADPGCACNYNTDPEKCCAETDGFRADKCCALSPWKDNPAICPPVECDYLVNKITCCAAEFKATSCCDISPYKEDSTKCPVAPSVYAGTNEEIKACCDKQWSTTDCCKLPIFTGDARCPVQPPCDYTGTVQQILDCCKSKFSVDECCDFETYTDTPACKCTYTGTDAQIKACCDQAWSREPCCALEAFENDARCEAFSGCEDITNPADLLNCCKESAPTITKNCCVFPDFATNPICTCDYNADRAGCCAQPDGFVASECCSIAPYKDNPAICSTQPPCDYTGTIQQILDCCKSTFSPTECCDFEMCQNTAACKCTYTGTDAQIKACCDQTWSREPCCKLAAFENDARCEAFSGCEDITNPAELLTCCKESAPTITTNCCAFPDFATNPICTCDYNADRAGCCAKPNGFTASECCSIAPYKDNPAICLPEPPCDYTGTEEQVRACCVKQFEKTKCCALLPWYNVDKRCPVICDYRAEPESCCARRFDSVWCCNLEGFVDDHRCCNVGTGGNTFIRPGPCSPPTCDFTTTPEKCCQDPLLFDPVWCCQAPANGFYHKERCCVLDAPFYVETKCPTVCPPSGDVPCVQECDYERDRANCCAKSFVHSKCCYLDPVNDANSVYDPTKCCSAFPHDFVSHKCCNSANTNDLRCVCDYTGTTEAIKACCTQRFDPQKCCSAFPTDVRCPREPCPPQEQNPTALASCCKDNYDRTKCCNKAAGGYYDEKCCTELPTSTFFDPEKCPKEPSCWQTNGATALKCCPIEFLPSKCCVLTGSGAVYDQDKCCALTAPWYVERVCNRCPDATPLPCEPEDVCDFQNKREECCKEYFDHEKCCHTPWHNIPGQFYLAEKCCDVKTDWLNTKCCTLYPNDARCVCDYVNSPSECCAQAFDAEKCCSLTAPANGVYLPRKCCSIDNKFAPSMCCDATTSDGVYIRNKCCADEDYFDKDKCECGDTPCEGCVNTARIDPATNKINIASQKKTDAPANADKLSQLIQDALANADPEDQEIEVVIKKDKTVLLMNEQQQGKDEHDLEAAKSPASFNFVSVGVAALVLVVSVIALAIRAQY